MTLVLVVERHPSPRAAALFEREGLPVVTAVDHGETLTCLHGVRPQLVVVEADAVDRAVVELCALIRATAEVPILLLGLRCTERDALDAFAAGVDSVVVEPVGSHELVARARAQLRRAPVVAPEPGNIVVVGPVALDCDRRELVVHGERVHLPRREFDIAEQLMRHAGRVVTRQQIVRALWGSARDTKSLDVQVGRLRARLAAIEGTRRILTVRGVGYRFLLDGDPELEPGKPRRSLACEVKG